VSKLARISVPVALLALVLAGCTTAPSGSDSSPDPESTATTPVAAAEPPNCEAVLTGFEAMSEAEGAAMSFGYLAATDLDGVGELPGDVLETGCFIQNPLGAGGTALIPNPDDSVYEALKGILTTDGFELDEHVSEGLFDIWVSPDVTIEAFPYLTVGNASGSGLISQIVDPFGDDTDVLYVIVSPATGG
jgi:hypothetical protein